MRRNVTVRIIDKLLPKLSSNGTVHTGVSSYMNNYGITEHDAV